LLKGNDVKRRNTQQRKIILDILRSTNIHPTADWIYEQARKEIPNISLGTVYRNLKILKESGQIIEINDGKQSRFDGRIDEHYHFKCISCERIFDVEKEDLSGLKIIGNKNFIIHRIDILITGVCNMCSGDN
jgi:Fur family ferric uptake transcriptional regulator/Fur family peroxide stress response transcriptional regulator